MKVCSKTFFDLLGFDLCQYRHTRHNIILSIYIKLCVWCLQKFLDNCAQLLFREFYIICMQLIINLLNKYLDNTDNITHKIMFHIDFLWQLMEGTMKVGLLATYLINFHLLLFFLRYYIMFFHLKLIWQSVTSLIQVNI